MGSAEEGSPDHLRNGLWATSQLIGTGSSRANKRLLIFTRDENPAGTGPKAESYRRACSIAPVLSPICPSADVIHIDSSGLRAL